MLKPTMSIALGSPNITKNQVIDGNIAKEDEVNDSPVKIYIRWYITGSFAREDIIVAIA